MPALTVRVEFISIRVEPRDEESQYRGAFLFVFLGIINTHGTVYSQNEQQVTISMKNAYLKDILWEIQRQTTFVFMYHEDDLDKVGKVNAEA